MDVFEALKKRRAVRHFKPDSISKEFLERLIYAAHRAPTGGNTPYRRLLVVTDRKIIRLMKHIAPGILGDPPTVIVIYTDLGVAEKEMGRMGRDVSSLIDAGASAENIALAAVALGLGSCFTKSYSEVALKELLNMPENCRIEVIMQVGYPQENLPPAAKPRPGAKTVYLNRFGVRWI